MSTGFHALTHLTNKNAKLHNSGMDYPEVLRAIMAAKKIKQQGLAKQLNVTQSTVSRWLKGAKPGLEKHQRILEEASRLGIANIAESTRSDAEASAGPPTVKVVGYVGAGEVAHFYAVAQGELDEVSAPEGATPETVAVEIRGNSLGELFDRWLIFYDEVRRPVIGPRRRRSDEA